MKYLHLDDPLAAAPPLALASTLFSHFVNHPVSSKQPLPPILLCHLTSPPYLAPLPSTMPRKKPVAAAPAGPAPEDTEGQGINKFELPKSIGACCYPPRYCCRATAGRDERGRVELTFLPSLLSSVVPRISVSRMAKESVRLMLAAQGPASRPLTKARCSSTRSLLAGASRRQAKEGDPSGLGAGFHRLHQLPDRPVRSPTFALVSLLGAR